MADNLAKPYLVAIRMSSTGCNRHGLCTDEFAMVFRSSLGAGPIAIGKPDDKPGLSRIEREPLRRAGALAAAGKAC